MRECHAILALHRAVRSNRAAQLPVDCFAAVVSLVGRGDLPSRQWRAMRGSHEFGKKTGTRVGAAEFLLLLWVIIVNSHRVQGTTDVGACEHPKN